MLGGTLHSRTARAVDASAPATGRSTAVALASLSLAAGNVALSGPLPLTVAASALALVATGVGAVLAYAEHRGADGAASPMAVTTLAGGLVASNGAFAGMMAAQGLAAHPDALAARPDAAVALYDVRRRACEAGAAEGFVPHSLFVRVEKVGERLIHTFEEVARPAAVRVDDAAAALVALVPAAAAVAREDGAILASNAAFRSVAAVGTTFADALAVDRATVGRLVAEAHRAGASRAEVVAAGASERRMRLAAKPFPGSVDAVLVCVSDVTDQSELEAQIAQSQKMQAIGQLAGGIAHDFNNVLTAILGFSDLLLQNHRPSDPAFRDIMNIKQSAQRAAGLVKQLLAFSRRQTLRPTVVNLNDVLADLSIMLDRLIGEPIRLELSYGRDLWPVLADQSQLEQVVINLAVNARDAMQGGGRLTIRTRNVPVGEVELDVSDVGEGPQGDAVLVEVEDVGTGMPQHILDKIFEPFFTTKATGEGTGLGLSTVYGIVKQTGGTLTVASTEGHGTRFRVYLPRATELRPIGVRSTEPRAADAARAGSAPEPPVHADAVAWPAASDLTGSATVLLVEDEEAIRTFAARALTAKGYTVLSAPSGVEAAEIFEAQGDEVDLLLTDVIMPELDGPGLVRRVRAVRPDLRVLFMSGYADGASVDELGDAPFLAKPFTLKALAEAVKAELARSPAR
ncbi:ATP-binding protein [Acuticoccus sp.]|uniref:ATP-binding protein n=1 Tax=Acuticoccus sp. TaxID=1904378 RepID=UPI003B52E3CC